MKTNISITGVKEIDTVLKELPKTLSHTVLSSAHAAAAKPLVTKMQLRAPEGPTGQLVDSIGIVKSSIKRADNIGEIRVGPRRRGKSKGYHAHLVEYGTKERRLKGKGKYKAGTSRGIMPKEPFVEPAFRDTKDIVQKKIAEETGKALNRTMKRYLKK